MRLITRFLASLLALALALPAAAQEATGSLLVQIKPFTSEVKLKKKVLAQLESGAIEWGIEDDLLVFTMVNKRFIDFNVNHMTRYGQDETIELAPGDYRITGIGLEMVTAFSPEKVLEKGAFLNEDVLSFRIEAGKTTTISINPIIRGDMTFLVKWYMPALMTRITHEGEAEGPEVAVNLRTGASLAWKDYSGPLKFSAKP